MIAFIAPGQIESSQAVTWNIQDSIGTEFVRRLCHLCQFCCIHVSIIKIKNQNMWNTAGALGESAWQAKSSKDQW